MLKEKIKVSKIFDYIFVLLFFYLSLKKSGFYKTDILVFSLALQILTVIYIIFKYIKNKEKRKFDIIGTLMIILSLSYLLPIIFSNAVSVNDALSEFIRYFNMYLIYKIVVLSDNKKIYKNFLVYLGVFLGIFGIDGMGQRFFENLLGKINSGYLNIDFDRMSSLIQYANTFGIILAISSLVVFDRLVEKIAKKEIDIKEVKNIAIYHTVFLFLISCIILSQSRIVIGLLVIVIYIYYLKNISKIYDKKKKEILLTLLFFSLLESLVYSSFVLRSFIINQFAIYYLTFILILLNISIIILGYITLKKIKNNKKSNGIFKKLFRETNRKKVEYIFLLSVAVYILLAMFVTTDLKMVENSDVELKRYVYNVENGVNNNLEFTVDTLEEDTRYKIDIYTISKENERKYVKTFSYYDTVSR